MLNHKSIVLFMNRMNLGYTVLGLRSQMGMMYFEFIEHWVGWFFVIGFLFAIILSFRVFFVSRRLRSGSMSGISRPLQELSFITIFPLTLAAFGFLMAAFHFFRCPVCGSPAGLCGKELVPAIIFSDIGLICMILAWVLVEKKLKQFKMIN